MHEIYETFVDNEAMLAMLLEERPAIVSFHFGLPSTEWIKRFRAAGIVTLACATNLQKKRRCVSVRAWTPSSRREWKRAVIGVCSILARR